MKFYSHLAPSTPSNFAVHTALCIAIETLLLMTTETSFPTLDKESPLPSETALLLQAVPTAALLSTEARLPPYASFSVASFCNTLTVLLFSFLSHLLFVPTRSAFHTCVYEFSLYFEGFIQIGIHPCAQTETCTYRSFFFLFVFLRILIWQLYIWGVLLPCSALHQADGAANMTYILSLPLVGVHDCFCPLSTPQIGPVWEKLLVYKNVMFLLSQD